MALVFATEVLNKAHKGRCAIDAFSINNPEWTKMILLAAEEAKSPVVLGVSEGAAKHVYGFKTVVAMIKRVRDSLGITVPVALHLDHGGYEGVKVCIEAGFTSVIFGGSHYTFEGNLAESKEMIELTHSKGLSIEYEVGGIGDEEDGVASMGGLADPQGCKTIAGLGVDFLAAGISNIHGRYPADWAGLNFEHLRGVQDITNGKPLVLHGESGIPADQITRAISLGVSKINVNTELQLVFAGATHKYVKTGKDLEGKGYDPRRLLKPEYDAVKDKVTSMMKGFGSYGKTEQSNKTKRQIPTVFQN